MKDMMRFGFLILLLNAAGVALAGLGYLCVRDGHEWFAVAFMAMAYCTIVVPKGSLSLSPGGEEEPGKERRIGRSGSAKSSEAGRN